MKLAAALAVFFAMAAWSASAAADPDCEAQVRFVHSALNREATRADRWNRAWQAGLALVTVSQMAAIPLVGADDRIDLYLGTASSLAGLISLAAMPPSVLDDAPRFEARLTEPDRCALARDGERLLERDAANEATSTGVLAHVGNVAFNVGLGAVLGFGFDHWASAILNVVLGTAVGEALLLTQPTALERALARYRAGDFASVDPPSRIGFASASVAKDKTLSLSLSF